MSHRFGVALGLLTSRWLLAGCLRLGSHPEHWACETSSDCPNGERCGEDSKCEAPACSNDKPCRSGQACFDGNCLDTIVNPNTVACFSDGRNATECMAFACRAGQCLKFCSDDSQCHTGYQCRAQTCELAPLTKADGSSCTAATECDSRRCCAPQGINGICLADCRSHGEGSSCIFDEQCAEGACRNNFCSSSPLTPTCGQATCGVVDGLVCGTCPSGLQCIGGQCQAPVCDPGNQYYCAQGMLNRCESAFVSTPQGSCNVGEICIDGKTRCEAYACTAERGFCVDDVYRGCNAINHYDGSVPQDCKISGGKCSSLGCGIVTVDEVPLPGPTMEITALACGNVILIQKATTLLSLQQSLGGGLDLRWFGYSSTEPTQFYERNLMVTDTTAGNGTRLSPDLGLQLEVGRYYFIGATTAGSYFEVAEAPAEPPQLSFGQVIGGYCVPGGLLDPLPKLEPHGLVAQTISTIER